MSEEFTAWDYPGDFLKQFPAHHTGAVGDMFCRQARAGHRTVLSLIAAVAGMASDRLDNPYPGDTDENLAVRRHLLVALANPEAQEFARFILWRESLPYEERARLKAVAKAEKGDVYVRQAMASKPPTDKQLALLRAKGCVVTPRTRLEASDLIEGLLKGKGVSAR